MLEPISLAVVPRPGKFFGQVVIIFQRFRAFDIAGAGKEEAAATAPTALPFRKDLRGSFIALRPFSGYPRWKCI